MAYTIGLDYGTNSVRCLLVDTSSGQEVGTAVYDYQRGEQGIILETSDHNLARQDPVDYIAGLQTAVPAAIEQARARGEGFDPADIIAIGVDTTGSTPLPVDKHGTPLSMQSEFKGNLNALAWLWKDHTAHAEAAEITELAAREHPEYLAKCGGTYSSEWFFSKVLHCLRVGPDVFDAAYTWLECVDYIPALLTATRPTDIRASRCAAGHKAMFNSDWGGLPDARFLAKLHPKLADLRQRMYDKTYAVDVSAGGLTGEWAKKLGLADGITVAVGAFDAHLGAVGAGIKFGTLVKIIGTSACDMLLADPAQQVPDIPGVCGIVDGSILPGCIALEAGQSAVGDIFSWFVDRIQPGGPEKGSHDRLTERAAALRPGQSGLLGLDWNNGNRTVLVDQRLTGLLVGQTLHTTASEIYRALIEATAFGALTIIDRFEEYGVKVAEVVNCGGIAEKNPLLMQIYADVTGRGMKVSGSAQTCALGAAISAAVAAGRAAGGHETFAEAQAAMSAPISRTYTPVSDSHKVYARLYALYGQLHDAFGVEGHSAELANVMKQLLSIKDSVNK